MSVDYTWLIISLVRSQVCPACPTCSDSVMNSPGGVWEEGIDCGGSCSPCVTCIDGVRNGDEQAIDCGGSCPACGNCADGIQGPDEAGVSGQQPVACCFGIPIVLCLNCPSWSYRSTAAEPASPAPLVRMACSTATRHRSTAAASCAPPAPAVQTDSKTR